MRINQNGVARDGQFFSFTFEGESVQACTGESVAAALLSAKEKACRLTRTGEPRGVFCGMGVCGECTVLIDGRARRACMEMAKPGMRVQRQPALRVLPEHATEPLSAAVPSDHAPESRRDVEVLVVGAGPAGLAAARAAAQEGAQVLLVDERGKAGGQYFKQPGLGFQVDESGLDQQFREGLALYRSAQAAGVEFCFGATVWGAFSGPQIAITSPAGSQLINARRVIVSPGAYERPMPFPGWTLPGVMTTGAAQTLLRAYQTAPGQRVLVAGNGPLNLQVARELTAAGATVVAVVELAARPGPGKLGHMLQMGVSSPGLVLSGMGHMARLLRAGVPLFYQHRVCEARGDGAVDHVSIVAVDKRGKPVPDTRREFAVDAVCLGYGFLGQSEMARALGAYGNGDASPAASAESADDTGRSPASPAVFVVGDARGLGGAKIAQSQGALAGAAAARDLGYARVANRPHGRFLHADLRRLKRHRRFQKSLWSVYFAPEAHLSVADQDTVICRCESVTLGQVQAVLADGVGSIGAVKRETRAGMGRCQGRYCAGLLAQLVPAAAAQSETQQFFAPRPPFKPVSIAELATPYEADVAFDRSAGARAPAHCKVTTEIDPEINPHGDFDDKGGVCVYEP